MRNVPIYPRATVWCYFIWSLRIIQDPTSNVYLLLCWSLRIIPDRPSYIYLLVSSVISWTQATASYYYYQVRPSESTLDLLVSYYQVRPPVGQLLFKKLYRITLQCFGEFSGRSRASGRRSGWLELANRNGEHDSLRGNTRSSGMFSVLLLLLSSISREEAKYHEATATRWNCYHRNQLSYSRYYFKSWNWPHQITRGYDRLLELLLQELELIKLFSRMLVIFQVQECYCCFKRKLLFQHIWGSSVYFRPGILLSNSLGKLVFQENADHPRYLGKQCLFLTQNTVAEFPGEAI